MPLAIRSGTAFSGLLLVLFLVVHLAGLIPALAAPLAFEHYADTLHHSAWLVLSQLIAVVAHLSEPVQDCSKPPAGNCAAEQSAESAACRLRQLQQVDRWLDFLSF